MAEPSHKQDPPGPGSTDPLCGRVLNGRFSIIAPIGNGGMGKVYKAIQSPLDRIVAVKVLHPQFSNSYDPGFVKRFSLEASLTSKLRHPNTVTVIDYGKTDDGIFYIAMEYLDGLPLSDVLTKLGALPWPRALHIGSQVCRSLREAHKFGIVHRDLKPANVMLLDESDQDLVKVLDFGLVKSFVGDVPDVEPDAKLTHAGMLLGSPQYMSPEQARNHSDQRSDVYSFGVLLYEMIAGQPPFTAKDYLEVIVKHLKEPPPPFRTVRPDLAVPQEVEDLVFRCLEKDAAHRFQSMDEVLDALRVVGGSGLQSGFQDNRGALPVTTPPPMRHKDVTPRPGALYTPAPAPQGTPPPYSRRPTQALGSSASSGRGPISRPAVSIGTAAGPSEEVTLESAPHQSVQPGRRTDPPRRGEPAAQSEPPRSAPPVPDSSNVFSAGGQRPAGRSLSGMAAGIALAAVLGGVYFWMNQPQGEADPNAPLAAPRPPAAATGKPVRFKVSTDPPKALVFMGAKTMGETPVEFEVPTDSPDGTVTVDLVLILDGYYPLPVTAGGSGVVLITQRMQSRTGSSPPPATVPVRPTVVVRRPSPPRSAPAPAPQEAAAGMVDAPELMAEPPPGGVVPPTHLGTTPGQPVASAALGAGTQTAAVPAVGGPTPPPPAQSPGEPPGVVHFNADTMTRPQLIEKGRPLRYTEEALHARVEGLMIVKCIIATNGRLEQCRFIKTLPHMEKAVLDALASRVYKPLTQNGQPVAVDYVFDVKLKLPTQF